jgi:hypothetical protein
MGRIVDLTSQDYWRFWNFARNETAPKPGLTQAELLQF